MAKPFWGSSKVQGDLNLEPELKTRTFVHKRFNRWCVPFPGSEEIVVERTQNYLKHFRPIQFKRYHSLPSLFTSLASIIGGFLILLLLKFFCLSTFFIKYPRIASLGLVTYGDPDEKIMETLRFDYLMVGVGWKGDVKGPPCDEMIVEVYPIGKRNALYEGTAIAVIYSALTILTEREKIHKCGVLTPGSAFKNTSIIDKLNNDNLKFEIKATNKI